jgi:hypothetical protein
MSRQPQVISCPQRGPVYVSCSFTGAKKSKLPSMQTVAVSQRLYALTVQDENVVQ